MPLFLGIDGGQSSTTAVIGDDTGRILGSGRGGPCNHVGAAEGRQKFIGAVGACIDAACSQAGLDPSAISFQRVCAGFSGGPGDKAAYLRDLIRASEYDVTTDAVVALAGATAGEPGMICVAGTGSIAYGRNAERKFARVGGWGYIFGDEGGGFDLTRQALRAILRHEEGWGPNTALHGVFLAETGAKDANDLMHRFYTTEYSRPQIASYSKLVDRVANTGDAVARNIIVNAAQQLATALSAVRMQLFERGEAARVAYVGGVFRSEMLRERFRLLVELEDGNRVIAPQYGPGVGALIEAYAGAGLTPTVSGAADAEKG
ncbi:MAG TPA: BadF/BadG/BcrA/BcrD ATPase family protein [Bryobacteraceae bacterium]|nr:BadF/BadG/BcrA/BcrD ATPase family protein [Bryobacteraceae bacterium]